MSNNNNNNDFDPILVGGKTYDLDHLKNIFITVDIKFDNGDVRPITIMIRPTNHVFSREAQPDDYEVRTDLAADGFWLPSFVHNEGNFNSIKGDPPRIKEFRVFCPLKHEDSLLLPLFAERLNANISQTTVLANAGDDKTCLSGILTLEGRPNDVYLVFFGLFKVNGREVNMLIHSAYCVDRNTNIQAKKLDNPTRESVKPFAVVLKNVLEGRKPFEGKKNMKRSKKRKTKITKP